MTDACIIEGTFADLKSVKTRSVVQLIVEVPIEQASQIVAAFGFPQPGSEIAVAVARLIPEKAKAPPAASGKDRTPFPDLPLSQQAGIRCGDEKFWEYLKTCQSNAYAVTQDNHRPPIEGPDMAAYTVRIYCGVGSRSALNKDYLAGELWKSLNAEYEQWAGLTAESR